jgi:outer membrane lipoprotein-sorting protein
MFRRGPETDEYRETIFRDGDRLRIEFEPGSKFAGQIIVEDARERRHFYPDRNEIRVSGPRREESLQRLMNWVKRDRKFTFAQGPGGTVAGLATTLISIRDPRGNVMQKLYIEPRRAVVLKRELFDPVGSKIGTFEFENISFRPRLTADLFEINRRGARVIMPMDDVRRLVREKGFAFRVLPASTGFRLEGAWTFDVESKPVLVQMYRAGEDRVSLHQTLGDVDPERLRKFAKGRDQTIFTWRDAGRSYVLVGEQSEDALRQLSRRVANRE